MRQKMGLSPCILTVHTGVSNMRAVVQMRKWNTIKGVKDMGMIKILLVFVGTVNYAICFDDISIE